MQISQQSADHLTEFTGVVPFELEKEDGATKFKGVDLLSEPIV
jgi:hypothetical protein